MTQKTTQNGWTETTLGEMVEISSSKRIFAHEYKASGIPFFRGKEVTEKFNGNAISTELFITKERYTEIKNKHGVPKENDILLTSVGTLGNPYLVEKNLKFYFKDGNLTWFREYKNIDPKFLFYWIISPIGKETLSHAKIGSTQQAYTIVSLKKLPIIIPDLTEQKAIASVLSSLDDKIELLREQSKTLEGTAQTVFKEWFVKFNFPEATGKMVNSELGEIPEGWRVGKLGEIIDFIVDNRGKTPVITKKSSESIPLIEVNALVGSSRIADIFKCKKYVNQETYEKWFRKGHPIHGDILISTVGSIGQISQIFNEKISVAQNIIALRYKGFGNYLYELLKNIQKDIISINISSVQPSIKMPHLLNIEIIHPPKELKYKFQIFISPVVEKIYINSQQIQTLSALRDTLLPQLMSGKVRVKNF